MPDSNKLTRRGKFFIYLNGSLPEWNTPLKNRLRKSTIGGNVCYLAGLYFFPLPVTNNSTYPILDDYVKGLKEQNQDRTVNKSLASLSDPSVSIWISETQNERQTRIKTESK
jgi:hypothetical protein